MKKSLLGICIVLAIVSVSCNKEKTDIATTHNCALVIRPPASREIVYEIGSVFFGGATPNPWESSLRCSFYQEKYSTCPKDPNDYYQNSIVRVTGYMHKDVEYSDISQSIEGITIRKLDESLGLGPAINIPMEYGEYKGGNDLIEYVKINSFKYSNFETGDSDSNINIYIRAKSGLVISIRYINGETKRDGGW